MLYGHAWMSGALTTFAFIGFVRAFDTTPEVWFWVSGLAVGPLWTVLGFSYAAGRDSVGRGGDDLEGPAPALGTGRPPSEVTGPSRPRSAPARYVARLLMLLVFLAVAVLLAAAAKGWWSLTTRRSAPRPMFVNPTGRARALPPPG
jgi:hypothetical protein